MNGLHNWQPPVTFIQHRNRYRLCLFHRRTELWELSIAMNGVNIPQVKVEYGDGHSSAAEPQLKPESDSVGASPSALSEDDIYEDTGDLDFSQCQDVRLMRIPKWLWENWAIIDDDEEIQIGTVRMENLGKDKNGHDNQKVAAAPLVTTDCK